MSTSRVARTLRSCTSQASMLHHHTFSAHPTLPLLPTPTSGPLGQGPRSTSMEQLRCDGGCSVYMCLHFGAVVNCTGHVFITVMTIVLIIMIMFSVVAIIIITTTTTTTFIFAQVRHRNHSYRSKRCTCIISHRYIFRISSLALLFTGCIFVAIDAAQHVNAAPVAPVGTWATALLSVARESLAATSLSNDGLAIFAGGVSA